MMVDDAKPFSIVRPITITDSLLTSSSIAEPAADDPAAWSAATAYSVGNQVSRPNHLIYERLVAGTTATAPESDTTNWTVVGYVNRWRMFDGANSSQSFENDGSIAVTVTPTTLVDTIVLDNLDADSVRVQVATTSYDKTINLKTRGVNSWWDYYYEPFVYKKTAVFTGLPYLIGKAITITVTKSGSAAKVGTCVIGLKRLIGHTQYGAGVGIVDYSTKDTDKYGNTTVVKRVFSKKMTAPVVVQNTDLDAIIDLLSEYRATPAVWLGADDLFTSMVIFGFYKDYDAVVQFWSESLLNINIEGLT